MNSFSNMKISILCRPKRCFLNTKKRQNWRYKDPRANLKRSYRRYLAFNKHNNEDDFTGYDRTPLMKQWSHIKTLHPDYLVLFQVGDFYEMFHEGITSLLD